MRRFSSIVLRYAFVALVFFVLQPVVAQADPLVRNLGAGATTVHLREDWLVYSLSEGGEDLNGDGDTGDEVLHLHNLSTGETTNLRLSGWCSGFSGDWLVLRVSETNEGEDLNGDGDTEDTILHLHRLDWSDHNNDERR